MLSGSLSGTWDAVVARLEAFVAGWESGVPPRLDDHLPDGPSAVRQRVLLELVKVDLDERLRAGCPRSLEDYCAAYPELSEAQGPPIELIHEDFHLRRQRGEQVSGDDYCLRFPGRADEIRHWCRGLQGSLSTSLAPAARLPDLAAGETLDDFLLVAPLGRGAFAAVWLARQISLGRLVALKISADRGHEACTLAQLEHPHIVRVFDQRHLPDRGLLLVYEQFLPGGTLADVVARVRRTPPRERSSALVAESVAAACAAVGMDAARRPGGRADAAWVETVARIGIDLALALDHAHACGILHRDVKPANVLLGADGSVHLADFNTSYAASHPAGGPAASFGGSLAYMAPEHLEAFDSSHERRPEELDGRADLYSLAVLLFELLAGRRPFEDATEVHDRLGPLLHEMIERRRTGEIDGRAASAVPGAGPLLGVLRSTLSPQIDERPVTGAEFARRLSVCLSPRAAHLIHGAGSGWTAIARRNPLWAAAACVLIPNAVLSCFNYFYNYRLLLEIYSTPELIAIRPAFDSAFQRMAVGVNLIGFSCGLFFVWFLVAPIARGMQRDRRDHQRAWRAAARRHGLLLGDAAAWIGVSEWLLAGIAFPLGIRLQIGPLPPAVGWLFLQSPVACGLLAAAYPFFLATLLTLRVFYPAQLAAGGPDDDREGDVPMLEGLARRSGYYLLVAGGVPLVALGFLLVLHQSSDRWALVLLTAAGLAGLSFATWARQAIQSDIAAVETLCRPLEDRDSDTTGSVSRSGRSRGAGSPDG